MTALVLIAGVPVVMWVVQTAALRACGLPMRWRIDTHEAPKLVRLAGRLATQSGIVGVLVAYPILLGHSPGEYYRRLAPWDAESVTTALHGLAAAVLFLCALYLAWLAADCVRFEIRRSASRLTRHLVTLPLMAAFGATVEELLFRGVVVADLLRWVSMPVAVMLGAAAFAGAHYVRSVKRRWTFPGHVLLGVLLCVAFVRTGDLWLAAGLHAGGILVIMGLRPFIRYTGPQWLTGVSIYPYAGAAGVVGLTILTAFVWHYYGAG